MYLVQDKGTIIVDTGLEKTRGKYLEAFSGEMRLPFLAADESRLFESYGKLLGMAEVFYGGHGTPLLKKEMLELIRKDKFPEALRMLGEYCSH